MLNPWKVQNIHEFNYYCCPECVFRSKEDMSFQAHAPTLPHTRKTFIKVLRVTNPPAVAGGNSGVPSRPECV